MQGPIETAGNIERLLGQIREIAARNGKGTAGGATPEKDFARLEELWMEAMEMPLEVSSRVEGFLEAAEELLTWSKETTRAGTLLELLLSSLSESTPLNAGLRIYWLLLKCFPSKKEYRAEFFERFEAMYPMVSPERAFYEACGLATAANLPEALTRLEKLLKFKPGAHVFHASGWGVGKVVAVDPFLKQVKVNLQHKRDHRIAINVVDSILELLLPDSFLVLREEGGSGLRALRDKDPVRLITLVLEGFGNPLSLKEIKAHLVPEVLGPDAWSKWWNRAKGLLRDTGLFRVADRAPYLVEMLEKAVSYEAELVHKFLRADWREACQIARQVARRTGNELEEAWSKVRERLLQFSKDPRPVVAMEAAMILDRGENASGREALRQVFDGYSAPELAANFQELLGAEEQRRAAESLPEVRPADWQEVAVLLLMGKKDILRDVALDLLEKDALPRAQALLSDLLKSPKAAPEAFCYVLQAHLRGSQRPALESFRKKGGRDLLVLVVDLLDHLQYRSQRGGRGNVKDIVGRIEGILVDEETKFFLEGTKVMESPERHDLYSRLVKNESLVPQVKGRLLEVLTDLEPSLGHALQTAPWEEDAIYVTVQGLSRKKEEFREIMDVKLPKNFQDIGRAASFGDLSENAEYTSALEERDHLTKRAANIKADLDKAKVIDPELVTKGVVGLGSRIRLRNTSTKEEVAYNVLGPWDGGPEDGVLSYLSPLCQLFLGKKEGEKVVAQLPGGTESYELLESTSYFDGQR